MTAQKRTGTTAAAEPAADVSRETADVSRETSPTTGPAPSLGRIVHYRLSKADAQEINRRRKHFKESPPATWGYQAHVGNHAAAGQVFPADIVRIFSDNPDDKTAVNLQVKLDGTDTYWATSRTCGDEDGQWSWPARA
jgi:hypothetical protein